LERRKFMKKVLVLTEHPMAGIALETILGRENFVPILAQDEKSALQRLRSSTPEVLIIDLPFAEIPSIDLFVRLHLPKIDQSLIVLAESGDEFDKVLALEAGADDYLVKPYAPRELVARIRALLRRRKGMETLIRFGQVEVDLALGIVLFRGAQVSVTPSEYRLLSFFLNNANRALCRKDLLRAVWGRLEDSHSRTLDAHVRKLRKKFEEDPAAPRHFLTVHCIGYRFLF
jgi:DNA-binding response OmpR family regulator